MGLTVRQHGGTDALGAVAWDLSTNSNSCGPCPTALAAVQTADASRYPDPQYVQLRDQLARFHGVAASRIVLAASASECIFRLTAWAAQQGATRVWLPAAAYADYGHAAAAWQLQPCAQQTEAHLVWACEPSSPLGQAHALWPEWLAGAASGNQLLVLDCAYAPLRLAGQRSLDSAQRDRVWQLYSPNKALGLTGVRAAYAIAPMGAHEAVLQLEALAPSWPVGAHGVAMLQAWTSAPSQDWLQQCLPRLQAWKTSQVEMLQSQGWQCLPSETNFFCARPPQRMALEGWLRLLRAMGIKLRDATSLGMPGHVRMSVQPPPAQRALAQALFALQDSLEVTP